MNEMKMLRDHYDGQQAPASTAVAEARARLLAEARPAPTRRPLFSGRERRRYALIGAGVTAIAAAAVITPALLGGDRADRAYAVERLANGTIKVTLREFTDSAGLQRKLNELGVPAVVDYLPRGMTCAEEPRAKIDDTVEPQPEVVENDTTHGPGPVRATAGDFTFYLRTERIKPGQTLVWTLRFDRGIVDRKDGYAVGTMAYLARGPVKPCNPVPRPLTSR